VLYQFSKMIDKVRPIDVVCTITLIKNGMIETGVLEFGGNL
jgi:hypothetical protein